MDRIIDNEKLTDTFAHLDNVTICGRTQEEHDCNLQNFFTAAEKYDMTFNNEQSIISTTTLKLMGYIISNGCIKPDPERLRPLKDLSAPHNLTSQ